MRLTSNFPESGCTSLYGLDGALHNRSFVQPIPAGPLLLPGGRNPLGYNPPMQRPPQIVGNIGLDYDCSKLSGLGWNVIPPPREARKNEVVCISMDRTRRLTIRVRSLSERNPVTLPRPDKIMGDFWVIVGALATGKPKTYILLPHEVREMARRWGKEPDVIYTLEPKDYAANEFEEKWQRIGRA